MGGLFDTISVFFDWIFGRKINYDMNIYLCGKYLTKDLAKKIFPKERSSNTFTLNFDSLKDNQYYKSLTPRDKINWKAKIYLGNITKEIANQIHEDTKNSIEERAKNNSEYCDRYYSILDNCIELLNILKAESIEKYCKSFSRDILIKEDEFKTEEEKIDILDRFKDALAFVNDPKKRADKLLKAIYLVNIVKIEFKLFNSNNYDTLLKMIDDCVKLKVQVPQGCGGPELEWFNEICNIKLEIEEKQRKAKENPKEAEQKIKNDLKDIINEIENKSKQGKIQFFFYILSKHKQLD